MDINEVAKKSLELKENIANLIQKFERETTCRVEDIYINRIEYAGSLNSEVSIEARVILL